MFAKVILILFSFISLYSTKIRHTTDIINKNKNCLKLALKTLNDKTDNQQKFCAWKFQS